MLNFLNNTILKYNTKEINDTCSNHNHIHKNSDKSISENVSCIFRGILFWNTTSDKC